VAGYRLEAHGIACLGMLACGPQVEDSANGGSGGYDISGTAESENSGVVVPDSYDGGEDTEPPAECSTRGDICGEFSVCQCDCDYDSYCCACEPAVCTADTHCNADERCLFTSTAREGVELACVPAHCEVGLDRRSVRVVTTEQAESHTGETCVLSLEVLGSDLVDATAFSSLQYVHSSLSIRDNPGLVDLDGLQSLASIRGLGIERNAALMSIAALSGLESVSGGVIRDNPMLPTAHVQAVLDGVAGGEDVEVCGNLDGDPCL